MSAVPLSGEAAARPGAIVSYRGREWVVLPSDDEAIIPLRPIGGSARETTAVIRSLLRLLPASLPHEQISAAEFAPPSADELGDNTAVQLLQQSARLLLRDGAAPFRSLGQISVRPRPYQYVPLLMALRLPIVRLLIADDVGIGKTVEAGLIARELLARGLVRRVGVLCPPYLCDQWQRELSSKFNLDAVVIRAGTVARLERGAPPDRSIFETYPHFVASIDTVKGDRYRNTLIQYCPDLLIVDEVHGAAEPPAGRSSAQQQRHELLRALADRPDRHLVLLSATPHSGVESSFRSLLGLLQPEFGEFDDLTRLTADETIHLARHFVQRRRADVRRWMEIDTPFPERDTDGAEQTYRFTPEYRAFYNDVYEFARGMVQSAKTLTGWRQRMRFWSALALLRCVSSSPAAAEVALRRRMGSEGGTDTDLLDELTLDETVSPFVHDPTEAESAVDAPPTVVFELQAQDASWGESDRRRLNAFARTAEKLKGAADPKLAVVSQLARELLAEGYQPIIWCRYIATADYVAGELAGALGRDFPGLKVTSVTGALGEDERRLKIDELSAAPRRILVATDCLSEGVNLQEHFDAVIHYDLPWNPNRLEQRNGRVDRFGQLSPRVKAILLWGADNPVDGAVLDVLLRKAREIYETLGVHVPLPADSETVMEAVLQSLFERGPSDDVRQLGLFERDEAAAQLRTRVHSEWTQAAQREQASRTRFAQHSIRPEQVERELRETDRILGGPEDILRFLNAAAARVGFRFRPAKSPGGGASAFHLDHGDLPEPVRARLGALPTTWAVTLDSPAPPELAYIGRNHPLIEGLAEHLFDLAFHPLPDRVPPAARVAAIRTGAVSRRTTLYLLRLRFLLHEHGTAAPVLAEEILVWGYGGRPPDIAPLPLDDAARLLEEALPSGNLEPDHRLELAGQALDWWQELKDTELAALARSRADELAEAHWRVRETTGRGATRVEPQLPPDLLGVVVLLP